MEILQRQEQVELEEKYEIVTKFYHEIQEFVKNHLLTVNGNEREDAARRAYQLLSLLDSNDFWLNPTQLTNTSIGEIKRQLGRLNQEAKRIMGHFAENVKYNEVQTTKKEMPF